MTKNLCSLLLAVFFTQAGLTQHIFRKKAPIPYIITSASPTSDGGYAFTGSYMNTDEVPNTDLLLVKTNSMGDTVWTRSYGDSLNETGTHIKQLADGGFIVAGYTNMVDGLNNFYMVRTDAFGTLLWSRVKGGPGPDAAYSIDETPDGGFIVGGMAASFSYYQNDIYIIKTDNLGNTVWSRNYRGVADEVFGCMQKTSDNNYLLAVSRDTGNYSNWLLKINQVNGDTIWTQTYRDIRLKGVVELSSGGFALCGYTGLANASNISVIRTNVMGIPLWMRSLLNPGPDYANAIIETSHAQLVLTGKLSQKPFLMTMDLSGNVIWLRNLGDSVYSEHGEGLDLKLCNDNGYLLVTGNKTSSIRSALIKTDSTGHTTCYDSSYSHIVSLMSTSLRHSDAFITTGGIDLLDLTHTNHDGFTWLAGCGLTGEEELRTNNGIVVYPNPFSGVIHLNAEKMTRDATVKIISLQGNIVHCSRQVNGKLLTLDLSAQTNGIYILECASENEIYRAKIIKTD